MKYITIFVQLFFMLFCLNTYRQLEWATHVCEAQVKQHNRTKATRAEFDLSLFDLVVTIFVTVHIIRDANGNCGLSIADLQYLIQKFKYSIF